MATLRAILQAVLTVLGVSVAFFGATLAASIDVPPGGGDIPTGFAMLFSWALVAIGVATAALGLVLLDETGVGAYLARGQRRLVRAGGGLLLVAAVLPFLGVLLLPVLLGYGTPGGPETDDTLLSVVLFVWLAITALGVLGVLSGVVWRVIDILADHLDLGFPGQN